MIDVRWRKVRRDLTQHRGRSLLLVLAMAVALLGAATILNTWTLVKRATEQGYRASLPVSATLTLTRVDAELLQQVRALPEVASARARRSVAANVQAGGRGRKAVIFVLDDFMPQGLARLMPHSGAWPPPEGALVIEKSSLEFSGAALGETLAVALPGGQATALPLVLRGVVRDVSLAPGWMENVVYAFATSATAQALGAPAGFDELQFRLRDAHASRAEVRRVTELVAALAQHHGQQVLRTDVPVPGEHVHAAQMNSLLLTQGAFALLALLVCGFLGVNLFNALLAGQAREIGVMKTLGARRRQLTGMYLSQALCLGAAASLLALPLAAWTGHAYADFKGELLNLPVQGYAIPWWAWLLQLAVGCGMPVLAAALPVARACRQSVGAVLRDIGIVAPGRALVLRRLWLPAGWARPMLLSLANAFRRRQRLLFTLLALATAGAVQLGAANLRGAVTASVDMIFNAQAYDVSLRLAQAGDAATLLRTAAAVPGVMAAEAWYGQRARLSATDGAVDEPFSVVGLPPTSTMAQPTVTAGRWLRADDGRALVVSRLLLRQQPALALGAEVDLVIDQRPSRWRVVGVVETGTQPLAYVPTAALQARAAQPEATSVMVTLTATSPALQIDTLQRLRAALQDAGLTVATSQRPAESRRVVEDHLQMVVDFLGAMAWLMLAIGAMALASTMGMAVLERTREIGVLRAIGASRRDIAALVQVEGLVIVVLAWMVSLPLSVLTSVVLGHAFGRVMFAVPLVLWPDAAAALRWLALALLISLLACAWPARRATRVPVVQALKFS